jgi:hypothetical protein
VKINSAQHYTAPGDLCVITCLFNVSAPYAKLRNFLTAYSPHRFDSIPVLVVECAYADHPFEIPASQGVIQVRSTANLWQKERLLNCALARVSPRFKKIAWLDSDILFENSDWAIEASKKLDQTPIIQLFERVVRLPAGQTFYSGEGKIWEGFASVYREHPNALLHGDFAVHGHTGFAWAARREVLSPSLLYDGAIAGGGDHVMAHAFCGDWESSCLTKLMCEGSAWHRHAIRWAQGIYPLVRGEVDFVPGAVLHLWHGEIDSRRHKDRHRVLHACNFDPATDVKIAPNGCWEWCPQKPELHRIIGEYLSQRQMEGD